jgi:hypothetical protein
VINLAGWIEMKTIFDRSRIDGKHSNEKLHTRSYRKVNECIRPYPPLNIEQKRIADSISSILSFNFPNDHFALTVEIQFWTVNVDEMHRLKIRNESTSEMPNGKSIWLLRRLREECSTISSIVFGTVVDFIATKVLITSNLSSSFIAGDLPLTLP